MMRLLALLLVAALSSCIPYDQTSQEEGGNARPGSSGRGDRMSTTFRMVSEGGHSLLARPDGAASRDPFMAVARDRATYERLWHQYLGDHPISAVDFGRETVVFLLVPARPTGGYSVEMTEVAVRDGTLVLEARLGEPGPGDMVTQAFTAPYAVVAVPLRTFTRAEWTSEGNRVAMTETPVQ
ncbi:MAG TPA: protease complex subunit PrcB family protein [Thermoanaerobaculia bacterium]|nr:protease complex subunit PrcB family protein [Thermoanaerobaculia bacterium]